MSLRENGIVFTMLFDKSTTPPYGSYKITSQARSNGEKRTKLKSGLSIGIIFLNTGEVVSEKTRVQEIKGKCRVESGEVKKQIIVIKK